MCVIVISCVSRNPALTGLPLPCCLVVTQPVPHAAVGTGARAQLPHRRVLAEATSLIPFVERKNY